MKVVMIVSIRPPLSIPIEITTVQSTNFQKKSMQKTYARNSRPTVYRGLSRARKTLDPMIPPMLLTEI